MTLAGPDSGGCTSLLLATYSTAMQPTQAIESTLTRDAAIFDIIEQEKWRQTKGLELIASENFSSLATQLAHGNLLTDKYSEGYAGHRFYAGCDNVDVIEAEASRLACELFGADHAYVQPHSGADANLVAFLSILSAKVQAPAVEKLGETDLSKLTREQWAQVRSEFHNQKLLALDYYSGGHLTRPGRRAPCRDGAAALHLRERLRRCQAP